MVYKYLNQFIGMDTHDILEIMASTPITHCLCDSGSYYGYNYEKQLLPVDTPPISYEDGFIETTTPLHNLDGEFSFTRTSLYLSMQVNKYYDEHGCYYPNVMGDKDLIQQLDYFTLDCENTYNFECNIERVLQYCFFEYRDEPYISLQLHNGCDVRGGYTIPVVFHYDGDYDYWYDMLNYAFLSINTGSDWSYIDSYDGYRIEYSEGLEETYPSEFEECETLEDVFEKIIVPNGLKWESISFNY